MGRVGFGTANARDLLALRRSLARIPPIKALLAGARSAPLHALEADLDELSDVTALIGRAVVDNPALLLRDGGLIRSGYHAKLDAERRTAADGRDWLAGLEVRERERTGIPNLRVKYNEVFGFFLGVTKSHLAKVPPEYERRATVSNAERFITPELKARQVEILTSADRANDLEYTTCSSICAARWRPNPTGCWPPPASWPDATRWLPWQRSPPSTVTSDPK